MEYTATGSKGDAAPEGTSVKYLRTSKLGRGFTRRNDNIERAKNLLGFDKLMELMTVA